MAGEGTPPKLRAGAILRQVGGTIGGLLVAVLVCLAILVAIGEASGT